MQVLDPDMPGIAANRHGQNMTIVGTGEVEGRDPRFVTLNQTIPCRPVHQAAGSHLALANRVDGLRVRPVMGVIPEKLQRPPVTDPVYAHRRAQPQ